MKTTNTTVGVYDTHHKAILAVKALEESGIPVDKISFISKAEIVEDHLQSHSTENIKNAPVTIGAVLGPILGILAGASIIAVPGLGFLYGAGAIVGALAGLDIGLIGGGAITLLMTLGISEEKVVTYHKHLKEGKYLVILQGDEEEAQKAKDILHKAGQYIELQTH
jgi:hypothetical protein